MFKRLIMEEWQMSVPVVAFVLTFGAFVILTIRALRLGKRQSEHMARLPLSKDDGAEFEGEHSNRDYDG